MKDIGENGKNSPIGLAYQSLDIDYFCSIDKPIENPDVTKINNWGKALRFLTGDKWLEYITECSNAIFGHMIRIRLKEEANKWNDIVKDVNQVINDPLSVIIASRIPIEHEKYRDQATKVVLSMVRMTCVEKYYRHWVGSDYFETIFDWLQEGHLPCGAVKKYPSRHIYVM